MDVVSDADVPQDLTWKSFNGPAAHIDPESYANIKADTSSVLDVLNVLLEECLPPVQRSADGYHIVKLHNRIAREKLSSHKCLPRPTVLVGDCGDCKTGRPSARKEYAIFSLFARYYLDLKAIIQVGQKVQPQMWNGYPILWKDNWKPPFAPGSEYMFEGVDRETIVVDCFTAFICGFSLETYVIIDKREMEYDAQSGLPIAISFRMCTASLSDEQYANYRESIRVHATNGFTAAQASFEQGEEVATTKIGHV